MVHDNILFFRTYEDLRDGQLRILSFQGAEQEVFPGVSHHQVETPVPVDTAPNAHSRFEIVAWHFVDYLLPLVGDVGDGHAVHRPGVAYLSSPSGVECGAVQYDHVTIHRNYARLELRHVSVVSEYLVSHCYRPCERYPDIIF